MTRIVAGQWRGRRLVVPRQGVRPTSDRVREAVFSSLEHDLGHWDGLAVVDLFAGSGALGIEAASRGADPVLLVERDVATANVIRRNVRDLGAQIEVITGDAAAAARTPRDTPVDVLFADPPYDLDRTTTAAALDAWVPQLAPGALLVVETGSRGDDLRWPEGVEAVRDRRYGDTRIWYGRTASDLPERD